MSNNTRMVRLGRLTARFSEVARNASHVEARKSLWMVTISFHVLKFCRASQVFRACGNQSMLSAALLFAFDAFCTHSCYTDIVNEGEWVSIIAFGWLKWRSQLENLRHGISSYIGRKGAVLTLRDAIVKKIVDNRRPLTFSCRWEIYRGAIAHSRVNTTDCCTTTKVFSKKWSV